MRVMLVQAEMPLDTGPNVACDMAAAESASPQWIEPPLPARNPRIGRGTMFAEQEKPTGSQHAARLGERPLRIGDSTKRKGTDDAVEAGILELKLFALPGQELDIETGRALRSRCDRAQFGRRFDADELAHLRAIIKAQIGAGAEAELQYASPGLRYHLPAIFSEFLAPAAQANDVRNDSPLVPIGQSPVLQRF